MQKEEADRVEECIKNNAMVILYFSNKTCGACAAIRSKIEYILKSYPKVKIIDIAGEDEIEFASSKNVFSFPLFILYTEGKETIRIGSNIDFNELEKSIDRYYNMIF